MKDDKKRKDFKKKPLETEDFGKFKPKKKSTPPPSKINPKSNKFWNDIYDKEGDDI